MHFSSPASSTIRSLPMSALLCAPEACFLWPAASALCGDGKHQHWIKRWRFACTHLVSTALAAFLWPISRASALIDSVNTVPFPVLVFFRPTIILTSINLFSSVQFSRSVMSYSLRPHGLKHARLPCPLSTARACSNSCPLSQWCHPTISSSVIPSPPTSIFPSIRVFSNESALRIRWPKYWSFSFNISPSKEHPELISFRMDWLDLLAIQGTLKRLLQHHSSKASPLLPCK